MENNVITVRGLWLAVVLLTGLVAAVLAAAVFWLVKADPAAVFTAGGATFGGFSPAPGTDGLPGGSAHWMRMVQRFGRSTSAGISWTTAL